MTGTHRPPPAPCVAYGDHPDQVANLHLPAGEGGPWPVVVVVHGGFWRRRWDRTTTTPLARALAMRGLLAWNIEYRRVGQDGGGWPGTLLDVAAAVDHVTEVPGADPGRVVAVGHSAGGHLALWLAARPRLPAGAPGAGPRVRLRGAVSLAGVCDLVRGAEDGLGDGAVAELLGGAPGEQPDRYAAASPTALLPLGVPQVLVHGGRDAIVPPGQSRGYARAASAAGDSVELVELPEADHFDVVGASHLDVTLRAVESLLG
ncbi:MAG TPA: alpha/beta fold hydrolase [Gaiellaceae bacterium]|nr:alpha/beta fold hydrolase [Gaiellaceae bacterium]